MPTLYLGYSHTVVENCEDAWTLGDADMTVTADGTIFKVGTYSAKCAVAVGASTDDVMMYETGLSLDLSLKDHFAMWIYSTVALNAGDIQFGYDEDANLASVTEWLNLPAIAAASWHRVVLPIVAAASGRNAVVSVGFRMHVDKGAFDFYADDIEAFIGNDYEPMAVVGITDPDEVQNFPGRLHELLDGSASESLGPYIRMPVVDLGVLTTKSDRVFVLTWWGQTDKVVYYSEEECSVVFQDPSSHSQPWRMETELGRSVVLKLREKTAWTVAPPSWSRA